ncbi:arginase family protein [Gemmatimonadota bacterium]
MPNRRSEEAQGRGEGRPAPPGPFSESGLPWELPHTFLGLDEKASDFQSSQAVIFPVPYESTTSFGGGTRSGPGAILEASRYIELWDQELVMDPSTMGIHTLPALELTREGAGPAMAEAWEWGVPS